MANLFRSHVDNTYNRNAFDQSTLLLLLRIRQIRVNRKMEQGLLE